MFKNILFFTLMHVHSLKVVLYLLSGAACDASCIVIGQSIKTGVVSRMGKLKILVATAFAFDRRSPYDV
jgi:hypothetical protein